MTVLREAERATAGYDSLKLTIAIAYGGHEEIADAVRDLVRQKVRRGVDWDAIVDEITPSAIAEHLYTVGLPNLDLIIRTSGEIRLSGFLLWQSVHSEFYFSDVEWPEFRRVRLSSRRAIVSAAVATFWAMKPCGDSYQLSAAKFFFGEGYPERVRQSTKAKPAKLPPSQLVLGTGGPGARWPAGVDIKHPLRIAALNASIGRRARRAERREWAGQPAYKGRQGKCSVRS